MQLHLLPNGGPTGIPAKAGIQNFDFPGFRVLFAAHPEPVSEGFARNDAELLQRSKTLH